jgi:tetratricopeptide (TPR) repeat protein
MMSPNDRALLTSLALEQQDFESIKQDMTEIVERLGRDSVLFMTHVNAATPDGSTIPAREQVIRWVQLAAQQLDVGCFDPTDTMREFGQERAMENGGLDLTHFTPIFSDRVYAELHREHVSRLFDAEPELFGQQDAGARQQMLADNLDAMMQFDDFLAGSRKLYEALRKTPEASPLIQLRGKMLAKIGDYDGSIRDLREFEASSNLPQEARVALLEALTNTGNWEESLDLAEGLLGDEYENTAIYECAADSAEQLGRKETALDYWKQAFRHDRTNYAAALKGLSLHMQLGLHDQLDAWRQEVLDHGGTSENGAFDIGSWALENGDEELIVQAFRAISPTDINGAEELIKGALSGGMFKAVANCLDVIGHQDLTLPARRRYERIAVQVSKIGAEFLAEGDLRIAYELASAARGIKPDKTAVRILRNVVTHYRNLIRQAYALKDFEKILAIADEAGDLIFESRDASLLVGVALSKMDRHDEALANMLKAHELNPDDVLAMRWAARIAATLGRYEVALPMYGLLATSTDSKAAAFAEERERFFATADRRALKRLRSLILEGRFEVALELADAIRRITTDEERIASELGRLHRALRVQLRQIENGETDDIDRERVLRLLLRLQPNDEVFLRRNALEMMRQLRFDEAAECWERLDTVRPGFETNIRNLQRCRILAGRQKKTPVSRGVAAA